jgi:hypothetical protein
VASGGRHTWSHPQLPLATAEENPEVILRKGKAPQGESFASESGISSPPSIRTPFSYSQLSSRPPSEVSHFLNFGSVPAEFSPPGLVSEGEILVTSPSLEAVPPHQTSGLRRFHPSFYYYCCTERGICTFRSLRPLSIFPVVSFENLFPDISRSHSFSSEFSST